MNFSHSTYWILTGWVVFTAPLANKVHAATWEDSSGTPVITSQVPPFSEDILVAQIIPDNTLGAEASMVTSNGTFDSNPSAQIEGGAIRGANLFHSFQEFNIHTGESVYFNNPSGIENILGRITGGTVSDIDGLLGVDGPANLFLLNPNGFIFGPNTQLDINGSFITSTANSFTFEDGSEFRAIPSANELFTVSVPLGVQRNVQPQGDITNSGNLAVGMGEVLTLFGDTILNSGSLTASNGTVQMLGNRVGVIDQSAIDVSSPNGGGTVLIGGDYQGQGMVPNAERTYVGPDVFINADAVDIGDGGLIVIWADDATHFAGHISAQGGTQGGDGGFVEVSGANSLDFAGDVNTQALNGQAGQLLLDPTNITIANIAPTGFTTVGQGDMALTDFFYAATENLGQNSHLTPATVVALLVNNDLTLEATDTIQIIDDVDNSFSDNTITLKAPMIEVVNASFEQSGGGDIILETQKADQQIEGRSVVINGGGITANVQPLTSLNAGDVRITTHDLNIFNGGKVDASTGGNGNSGQVQIITSGSIVVDGNGSNIASQVNPTAVGSSGGIDITTTNLFVRNEGQISASSTAGSQGNAGPVEIIASGGITIDGSGASIASLVESGATGISGGLIIDTDNLTVANGGKVDASTGGQGDSGSVQITANSDILVNGIGSSIASQVNPGGNGNSGGLDIDTNNLFVRNGGQVSATTTANGTAGQVKITANGDIVINGNDSEIASRVNSSAVGRSQRLVITTDNLTVENGGKVDASTGGRGDSGLVQITANGNILVNGDSSAIASQVNPGANGNSGGLDITADNFTVTNGGKVDASTGGNGSSGRVDITVDSKIMVDGNGSAIASQVNPTGNGDSGGILINTDNLIVRNEGRITASTTSDTSLPIPLFGNGESGSVQINAEGNITVDGVNSFIASQLEEGVEGRSGGVFINTNNLTVANGGKVDASTGGNGNSGQVQITADGNIVVVGNGSAIASQVNPTGNGDSGGIIINTDNLDVRESGRVTASTTSDTNLPVPTFGNGDSGPVEITATGDVLVNGSSSAITSQVETGVTGSSGGLVISTDNLAVFNGGRVDASTGSQGNSGSVNVTATGSVVVDGQSSTIASQVNTGGSGNSGGVIITTDELEVRNEGRVTASTVDRGSAGNILLRSNETLTIRGSGTIEVESEAPENGASGDLRILVDSVILKDGVTLSAQNASNLGGGDIIFDVEGAIAMRQGSLINAESVNQTSDSGNIFIDTNFLVSPFDENNDIIANAVGGRGGRVEISAINIWGFAELQGFITNELRDNQTNDLSASSQSGVQGEIVLTTLDIDPSRGLTELPTLSPTPPVQRGCSTDTVGESSFTVTGRGGLPSSPTSVLGRDRILTDLGPDNTISATSNPTQINAPLETASTPLAEAQALVNGPNGRTFFVSEATSASDNFWQQSMTCTGRANH